MAGSQPISRVSREIICELHDAFDICDNDGDGQIRPDDLQHIFLQLRMPYDQSVIKTRFNLFDLDKDESINFHEFLVVVVQGLLSSDSEKHLKQCFRILDPENKGYIDATKWSNVFPSRNKQISNTMRPTAQETVKKTEEDRINFKEFKQLMYSGLK